MPGDTSLSFDWILYAILVPPVLLALWELFRTRNGVLRK